MLFVVQLALGSNPSWEHVLLVAPDGFEPSSRDPESHMMDRYTKGLCAAREAICISIQPNSLFCSEGLNSGTPR